MSLHGNCPDRCPIFNNLINQDSKRRYGFSRVLEQDSRLSGSLFPSGGSSALGRLRQERSLHTQVTK